MHIVKNLVLSFILISGATVKAESVKNTEPFLEKAEYWIRHNLDSAIYYLDLSLCQNTNDNALTVKALSLKGIAFFFKGENDLSLESIGLAETVLGSIEDIEMKQALFCGLLMHKGVIANNSGMISRADSIYEIIISISEEYGFNDRLLLAKINLGQIRRLQGETNDAFNIFSEALPLCDSLRDNDLKHTLLNWMSQILTDVGEFDLAISYLEKAKQYHSDVSYPGYLIEWYTNMGYAYFSGSKLENSLDYYQQAYEKSITYDLPFYKALTLTNIGEIYYEMGDNENALLFLHQGLEIFIELGYTLGEFYALSVLSGVFYNKGLYKQGEYYLDKAEQFNEKTELGANALLRHYNRAYKIHKQLNNESKALLDFENYINKKEEISNKEIRWKVANLERQLQLLEKENKILEQSRQIEIFHLKLGQYEFKLAIIVSLAVIFLVLLGGLYYIQLIKRRKEKALLLAEMDNLITSYKLKNLQSRLSPHFIFNALNSLWSLLSTNNAREAANFLDLISSLIRFTIENSDKLTITFNEELEFVRNYLELETLIKRVDFSFNIFTDPTINGKSEILPMSIQTHVENAVKHGLIPRNKPGRLDIFIEQDQDNINIIIDDDGEGFQPGQKSAQTYGTGSGLKIQKEMIDLFNKNNKNKIELSITSRNGLVNDLAQGTRVKISIPRNFRFSFN